MAFDIVKAPVSFFDDSFLGRPGIAIEDVDCQETVVELTSAMERLLDSESLRSSMGSRGRSEIVSGKFSIERRNRTLREVYEISKRR